MGNVDWRSLGRRAGDSSDHQRRRRRRAGRVEAQAGRRAALFRNAATDAPRRRRTRRRHVVTNGRATLDPVDLVELRIERRRARILRDWEETRAYVAQKN